jgi:hypothetical protein
MERQKEQDSIDKIQKVLDSGRDTSTRTHVQLHEVNPNIVKDIYKLTGKNIAGYKCSIDRSEVNHTLNNHSNQKREENRGQIPVVRDDILFVPEIIDYPDNVIYAGKDRIGRETIRFEKVIDKVNYVVFAAILSGRKELAFKTLFKQKAGGFMPKGPTLTSGNDSRLC